MGILEPFFGDNPRKTVKLLSESKNLQENDRRTCQDKIRWPNHLNIRCLHLPKYGGLAPASPGFNSGVALALQRKNLRPKNFKIEPFKIEPMDENKTTALLRRNPGMKVDPLLSGRSFW